MKIAEALQLINQGPEGAPQFPVALVCGFTPLHLKTLLHAHLQRALPARRVSVEVGLFGDLTGNLTRAARDRAEAIALVLEWSDLDPRLGFRSTGAWGPAVVREILDVVAGTLDRLEQALKSIPTAVRMAIALPTLPLPPIAFVRQVQTSQLLAGLDLSLCRFSAALVDRENTAILNHRSLTDEGAYSGRYDFRLDLLTGFPFSVEYASVLADRLSRLLVPAPPKKGLITDLDDTFWHGILGEIGVAGLDWSLSGHQHLHGLYQKLLSSLAREGVFVGVASKNDATLVEQALRRSDLLIDASLMFPVEAHWRPKSGSVARILRTWNIGAQDVVFIDDSPMELAEVAAAHPEMTCLRFPKAEPAEGCRFLLQVRDLFGKERLTAEDAIRLQSVRANAQFQRSLSDEGDSTGVLSQANGSLMVDFAPPEGGRILELVNKTNQFNLNGIRHTAADWARFAGQPGVFVMAASYEDRFGPLGVISVLRSRLQDSKALVDVWVLSCRAFSRRIEHLLLRTLFDHFQVDEIELAFMPTPRNGPMLSFLYELLGEQPTGSTIITRKLFEARCPPLFSRVSCGPAAESTRLKEHA